MKTYYETTHTDGGEFPIITAHDTFEEATAFAEANGIEIVYEIGGNWSEYQRCWFCEEWYETTELIGTGVCARCARAIHDHEAR